MAFTGELEHLHIVDIIQLVNTARKSGMFSVNGIKGESRIIFSNGYIVGASHLNNKVRIGTVLVKMNAITREDLEQALEVQKKAGKDRKPLISTLIEMGKLGRDEATKGLKKLIEITLAELVGWNTGTFTLDTEAISVSPECSYPLSKMEQEISLDAQMLLMDALRIYDERERDRQAGKTVLSDEELFADVATPAAVMKRDERAPVITADDLGLGDIEHLERKMPEYLPEDERFDPVEIHRQKIKQTLAGFSAGEQEAFVSFLEKETQTRAAHDDLQRHGGRAKGIIFFSGDELIKHSVMTICKAHDVLVFATEGEEELASIIDQCLKVKILPVLVLDAPETREGILTPEKVVSLRQRIRERYPQVSMIQMTPLSDYNFTLTSLHDGVRAVFPKPSRETGKMTFIPDTIYFLETLKSYMLGFFRVVQESAVAVNHLSKVKERLLVMRDINEPSEVSLALLRYVSEIFERSISFIVDRTELVGEKAIGVYAEKEAGPTSVTRLKVPLSKPSVFWDVVEKGEVFFGEINDEVLRKELFEAIGEPISPTIIVLPMKRRGKTVALMYGDFGLKEAIHIQSDLLEILAYEAGLVLENALYRKKLNVVTQR